MKTAGILLLSLLLINIRNTQAATEFGENIPTRLAEIFAGVGPADAGLYADIMDDFPSFTPPAEFMVLGSVDRETGSAVYLSTTRSDAEARQAIVQAFTAEGWQEIVIAGPPGTNAGFAGGRDDRRFPTMLCHDDFGNLQINTTPATNEVLMTINHLDSRFASPQSCSELVASSQQRTARFQDYRNPLEEYLPRLELPPEVSRGRQPGGIGGMSGGNSEITTNTDLSIDWDLAQVFDFFASQIAAQGWASDGNSLSDLTAGGSWTRSPAPDISLLGMLSVVKKAENDYSLEFRLITLPIQIAN